MNPGICGEGGCEGRHEDPQTRWVWMGLPPDVRSKFIKIEPRFLVWPASVGSIPKGDCPSCGGKDCDTYGCLIPEGLRPVDIIADLCDQMDTCPQVDKNGRCPDECPYFTLGISKPVMRRVVRWDLLRKLIAADVDLKMWEPNEEMD